MFKTNRAMIFSKPFVSRGPHCIAIKAVYFIITTMIRIGAPPGLLSERQPPSQPINDTCVLCRVPRTTRTTGVGLALYKYHFISDFF